MDHLTTFLIRARRRRWTQRIVQRSAGGLAGGAVIGLVICLAFLVWPAHGVSVWVSAAVVIGLASGLVAGLAARPTVDDTARAIDRAAHLKDRVQSAQEFMTRPAEDPFRRLQLRDTMRALHSQAVARLFPWRWPQEGTWAAIGAPLALAIMLAVPSPLPVEATPTGPSPAVTGELMELNEDLEKFEELAEELDSDEMREMLEKLREMVVEMEENARTPEDAMMDLAKMSAALEAASAAFDPLLLEQMLKEIAEGFTGLDGFDQAADLLKKSEYDKAAEAVQRLGGRIGSGQQAMPSSGGLAEVRMGELAAQAGAAGMTELNEALSSLQSAIRSGSRSECEGAMRKLGDVLKKYGRRSRIGRAMRAQLARLGECKRCLGKKGNYCKACRMGNGQCQGGGCKGQGITIGLPKMTYAKSDSPNQKAGTGASMDLFGHATDLDSRGNLEQLTGQLGHGESEVETEISHEGTQEATRRYREAYAKYRKLSDQVMTEEAIPLAHRQTIKRYFELIHPDRVEAETALRDVTETVEPAAGGPVEEITE